MRYEAIVLGAGVAGSMVAKHLSASGARIALVGGVSSAGLEGLSERSVRLLLETGAQLEPTPAARSGAWGMRRVQGREWLVERKTLAESLRRQAQAAGASLYAGPARGADHRAGLFNVVTDCGVLTAPWLIDARGRRGPAMSGPKLLAVAFAWRLRKGLPPATRIEPFSSGWCWWASREGELFVQITRRPRIAPPKTWLAHAASALPELRAALEAAEGNARISARPAHARCAPSDAQESLWRVGDAAWAPDPLSGQGVYEALRSAKLVAMALGSVMNGGELEAARRFVAERQAHAFQRAVAIAADFYRENRERGLFWREVASEYIGLLADTPRIDPPRIEPRPVLLQGRIVMRDVLVTQDHPRGVWRVGDVPIAPLFAEMTDPGRAHDAQMGAHPIASVEIARRWLKQQVEPRYVTGPPFHEEFIRADF